MIMTRRLREDEWEKLGPLFKKAFGELPPDPHRAVVVIAEEEGEIKGLLVAQMLMHVEPLWVENDSQQRYLVPRLVRQMQHELVDANYAFSVARHPKVGRFLEKIGFVQLPGSLWRWVKG